MLGQILKCRKIIPKTQDGKFTCEDYRTVEHYLIRTIQKLHFPDDFETLEKGGPLNRRSRLLCLDPHFDKETNQLVVGGRLNFSDLPEETKHQIILPNNDLFTEKLILYYHAQNRHTAIETTLCILRQKFWIISGRREVRKAIHKCLRCRHFQAAPPEQKMASLSSEFALLLPLQILDWILQGIC